MWHRKRSSDDFSDEVSAHIEFETERLMRGGMNEDEARRVAFRNFAT